MLKIFLLIFSFTLINGQIDQKLNCAKEDDCNWRYITYFPSTFRTGYTEKIAVATYGFPNQVNLNVTLLDREKKFSSQSYVVDPGVLTELDYFIPFDAPQRVSVQINGTGTTENGQQWIFSNVTKFPITVSRMGINILIQTDRPIYKPGQKILGRVIAVDSNLLPIEGALDTVVIESPSGSRMQQFTNATLEDGIFSFDLELSTKPLLGNWRIKAEMLSQRNQITVEVKKYVLPKYEVKINPPPFISYSTKMVELEVCAKYSFGKPVFGRLEVMVCAKNKFSSNPKDTRCAKYANVPIYGCRLIRFSNDYFDMQKFYKEYNNIVFEMDASVKEDATSVTRKADQEVVDVQRSEVALSFESKDSFKPGIPFKVMLFAKYPDESPIPKLKVNISMGTKGFSSEDLIQSTEVEIIDGMYEIETPVIPFDAENINLKAQYNRDEAYPDEPLFNRETFGYATINPWYSTSHNYIQIEKIKAPVMSDTQFPLMISYTSSFKENMTKDVYYSMMCAGNIVSTGRIEQNFTSTFVIGDEDENATTIIVDPTFPGPPPPPPSTFPTLEEPSPPSIQPPGNLEPFLPAPPSAPGAIDIPSPPAIPDPPGEAPAPPSAPGAIDVPAPPAIPDPPGKAPSPPAFPSPNNEEVPILIVDPTASPDPLISEPVLDPRIRENVIEFVPRPMIDPTIEPPIPVDPTERPPSPTDPPIEPPPPPRLIVDPFPVFTTPTRPPFPKSFDRGNFSIPLKIENIVSPKCRVVVYYVHEDEIVADSTDLEVVVETQNKVSISFSNDEYLPGETMQIEMTGSPNSRVAMAAIDKSVQFLAEGNDIKQKDIEKIRDDLDIPPGRVNNFDRCPFGFGKRKRRAIFPYYGSSDYVDSEKAFADIGVEVLTNLRLDPRPCQNNFLRPVPAPAVALPLEANILGVAGPGSGNLASARPRTNFPETWIWEDFKLSEEGTKTITKTVPDTITSWYLSGFGVSQTDGLGIAMSQELRAFQKFFISLNLPYSVIRGEDVVIPAAVFNYIENACISVNVTLAPSPDYDIISGSSAASCISASGSMTALFRIFPKKLGRIPLRISAQTIERDLCESTCKVNKTVSSADILIRQLLVEPEGLKDDYTVSNFFCPKDFEEGKFSTEIQLRTPDDLVPGSLFSKIMTIGDIMGPSLSDIDKLLAMPYGCGEQNMLKFAPNIYVLNYLNSTNQMTPEITDKALNFMRTGYQRELTYKRRDGSYSAFGNNDDEGSTWLTAFVLKSYAQANNWIDIDPRELRDPSRFLLRLQDPDGCFQKSGQLHHKAMAGGVKTPVTLTAYVLTALMEAGLDQDDEQAQFAAQCVTSFIDQVNDSYSLAIIANMFSKMKNNPNDQYDKVLKKLYDLAIIEDGIIHFEEPMSEEQIENRRPFYYQARTTDIEQTAYALLAMLNRNGKDEIASAVPLVRWLSKQRNGLGGFSSTQDTVLALEGLSQFAMFTYDPALDMKISISDNGNFSAMFDLNNQNNLVLQVVEDVPVPSTLTMNAEGSGCALVQAVVNYNIQKDEAKPSFTISHTMMNINSTLNDLKTCYSQILNICVLFLGEEKSNMALLEVEMVSGFVPNEENFEKLQREVPGLKDIEVQENKAVFYFDRLDEKERCVNLQADQNFVVRETKPAAMRIYDYYDKKDSAVSMYGFTQEQCTKLNMKVTMIPV